MKIKLMVVGKTDDKNIQNLVSAYLERLTHYINFE
ncbi:MAG: 23S rRNA (pseudouridine(1915)-N(3))-methyltransferase RlmH, partial [Flavobacteriales bacterium CG11_big_fil_rev_8_21_14_0_20_35_7]